MNKKALTSLLTTAMLALPATASPDSLGSTIRPQAKPENLGFSLVIPAKKPENLGTENWTPEKPVEAEVSSEADDSKPLTASTETIDAEEPSLTIEERMAEILRKKMEDFERSPQEQFGPPMPTDEQLVEMRKKVAVPFELQEYEGTPFKETRDQLTAAAIDPEAGQTSKAAALQDLALFYLAHRMVPEAISIHKAVDPSHLTAQKQEDMRAISTALNVLSRQYEPETSMDLDSPSEAWPDLAFWSALNQAQEKNFKASAPLLSEAFEILKRYPSGFSQDYLPVLLEAAIDQGRWTLAKEMVDSLGVIEGMQETSAYQFLIGLGAHRTDRPLDAFDAYRNAAKGDDRFAQRARMAIVDLGLETNAMPMEDAHTFLQSHRYAWRGDEYEIEALKRLAVVSEKVGDRVGALEALGDIADGYPTSEAAKSARLKSYALLDDLYNRGLSGETSLSEFTETHRKMEPRFRYTEGFSGNHERFADHLLELGATNAAARSYKKLIDYLEVAEELNLFPETDMNQLHDIRMKRAQALHIGGQDAAAALEIENMKSDLDADRMAALLVLKAEVYAGLKNPEQVIGAQVAEPTANGIRLLAEAFWMQGDWTASKITYQKIHDEFPSDFNRSDAIKLLLAAHRDGDIKAVRSIIDIFPKIVLEPEWQTIADGLTEEAASISPLNASSASERLGQAQEAIERISGTQDTP